MAFTLDVNGERKTVQADGEMPLLWALRDTLDLTGTKYGCGAGLCGACTVLIDGEATRACMVTVDSVGDGRITTIEGAAATPIGRKLQAAWLELDVTQCGYCQAGQIMAASALLAKTPQPSDRDIDEAMRGNLCRCATYVRIRAAIKRAAGLKTADTRENGHA
jgi:isoquinoline 1-oxidoreductase alpha subunit